MSEEGDPERASADLARLRDACQPFVKAWALGRRTFCVDGVEYETATRGSLGLSDEGSLQIGDFQRLVKALLPPNSDPKGQTR